MEPIAVEALVALYAVKFNWNSGLQKGILDEDALQIVNAVKTKDGNWSRLGRLVNDTN
jgi:hypothetical protein